MSDLSFVCACCGQRHEGRLPDIAFEAPAPWDAALAEAEPARHRLSSDMCVVGDEHFFIRCVLEVPITGTTDRFGWGVWLSQSEANFRDYAASFLATPERSTFAYLSNRLPLYPDTFGLHARAHWRPGRERPRVEIAPSEHPLYRDWAEGITPERAVEFATLALHPPRRSPEEEGGTPPPPGP